MKYIYQEDAWPKFTWNSERILTLLADVNFAKGVLLGKMQSIGLIQQQKANLEIITADIIKSSEIEGHILNTKEVRSSVARKLGMHIEDSINSKRDVDGIVEMMIDAVHNYKKELTKERLFGWQSALFPTGYSGMYKIIVGNFRDDSNGPMQVVSGGMGKEKVHYEAPEAKALNKEMETFLKWLNSDAKEDLVLKAALAHLWFVTLHPFEDGNGRIARAISDMLLTRSDDNEKRFYSMSSQIQKTKKAYYDILEYTQKNSLDITDWLEWFLNCLGQSIKDSEVILSNIFAKHALLQRISELKLNPRQRHILDMLFDEFKGHLTSSKWAKITKTSQDSAGRDIAELVNLNILKKEGDGRSTHYVLK